MSNGNENAQKPVVRVVAPFTVELGDDNNRTITVDTLKLRLRGHWKKGNFFNRKGGGRDIGATMMQMPDLPGIRLAVNPREGTVRIYDPLADDKELVEQANRVMDHAYAAKQWGGKLTFVEEVLTPLDPDQMKTLLLEISRSVHGKCPVMTVFQGEVPKAEQLKEQPGRELYDMWSSNEDRPRYVDQVSAWKERMAKA